MQKCQKCGAPLEGFFFKTIGKLVGLKKSEKQEGICNKCEDKEPETNQPVQTPVSPPVEPARPQEKTEPPVENQPPQQ